MKRTFAMGSLLLACGLLAFGCAESRPVLYPNAHLERVGRDQAYADIEECGRLAEEYVGEDTGGRVAKETVTGSAIGAAVGAAAGAVLGSAGRGAAAGAAAGGAGSLTRGVIDSGDPDTAYKRFVEKCLRDKGYEPVGWR